MKILLTALLLTISTLAFAVQLNLPKYPDATAPDFTQTYGWVVSFASADNRTYECTVLLPKTTVPAWFIEFTPVGYDTFPEGVPGVHILYWE